MLREVIARFPHFLEVHLPQIFAIGNMLVPRLALVLVIGDDQNLDTVVEHVNDEIAKALPTEVPLAVWVLLSTDPLLAAVRNAQCRFS